ncbi:MAG: segregation/condensation protein A [bacterium]
MLKIKLEKFEGPFGLLFKLIEKEEMDVTQISLANVVDQYINYIRGAKNINPEEMADFLVIAAKLLLIKSKLLLPFLFPEEDEEIAEFEEQLRMYKEFLEAAKKIEKIVGKKKFMFAREFNRKAMFASGQVLFCPPQGLCAKDLSSVFSNFTAKNKLPEKLPEETLDKKISIEEKISAIQKLITQKLKISLSKILKNAKSRTEVIVSFLAALELMRQNEIDLFQKELFGEIIISGNKESRNN